MSSELTDFVHGRELSKEGPDFLEDILIVGSYDEIGNVPRIGVGLEEELLPELDGQGTQGHPVLLRTNENRRDGLGLTSVVRPTASETMELSPGKWARNIVLGIPGLGVHRVLEEWEKSLHDLHHLLRIRKGGIGQSSESYYDTHQASKDTTLIPDSTEVHEPRGRATCA